MRVTRNDNMEPGRRWVHIQLREIVKDVNEDVADVEHACFGEPGGPGVLVVVAAHGGNRSELSKLVNYVGMADVACVNDEVATAKSIQRLGAEQSMGVGDQPYAESTTRHGRCGLSSFSGPCKRTKARRNGAAAWAGWGVIELLEQHDRQGKVAAGKYAKIGRAHV